MGVLGYACVTFLGQGIAPISATASGILLSGFGHLFFGLVAIWIAFAINVAGVRQYGILVTAALILIVLVAATITAIGFLTPPHLFVAAASAVAKVQLSKPAPMPADSLTDFIRVCGLFIFSYTGLIAGPALGGEVVNAEKKVPLGLYCGWALVTVLFTAITAALFHAAPWWAVVGLIAAGKSSYATAPGLIGLVAPKWLTVALNLAVALIVWKTLVPNLMMSSRFCFAQAQDRLLPPVFARTSSRKVPLPALLLMAGLGSLFLVQSVFFGWTMGVAVRSLAVLGIWLGVAVAALNLRRGGAAKDAQWAKSIARRRLVVPAAILSIVISLPLMVSLVVVPNAPLFLQPLVQAVVILGIGLIILILAAAQARRRGETLASIAAQMPLE
jgi:amino acid transporter